MSYEHCDKHDAPATNGCEEWDAERYERTLLNLGNFLASYFGGGGERSDTQRFIDAFRKDGFAIYDDAANVTMDTLKRNEETMGAQLADARDEVRRLRDQTAAPDDLRAKGWMVAVHKDYRLRGDFRTFWLMTHNDSGWFLRGEGSTDAIALDSIGEQLESSE